MANDAPLRYDRWLQLRTDPEFRDQVDRLKAFHGTDASTIIRTALSEKYARDIGVKAKSKAPGRVRGRSAE